MIGWARTGAAISVVNALFDGQGAAVGLDLALEVTVALAGPGARAGADRIAPIASATPLVLGTVGAARSAFGLPPDRPVRVTIASEIPPSVGLKSSSAVGAGIVLAFARAAGVRVTPESVARTAAKAARAAGQSATGAFDDALAALSPGVWATDNREDSVLFRTPAPDGSAVIWIPPGEHPPSPELAPRLRGRSPSGAMERLRAGDLAGAVERNGRAVEGALGLAPIPREALALAGARAVGVSGLGPAVFVWVGPGAGGPVRAVLERLPGRTLSAGFRARDATEETG